MAKTKKTTRPSYVICLERGTYRIDLDVGKVYRTAPAEKNDTARMLRVIDDSGEDYLYPAAWFVPVELPPRARKVIALAGA